jgi:hypothetical protein
MHQNADVLNPRPRKRQRIRRLIVKIPVTGPGWELPPRGRRNPHGFKFANEARKRQAREKTEEMVCQWFLAGKEFRGVRGAVVAYLSKTTRAAVYQRMYRWRRQVLREGSTAAGSCRVP